MLVMVSKSTIAVDNIDEKKRQAVHVRTLEHKNIEAQDKKQKIHVFDTHLSTLDMLGNSTSAREAITGRKPQAVPVSIANEM